MLPYVVVATTTAAVVATAVFLLYRWLWPRKNIWAEQNVPYLDQTILSFARDSKLIHISEKRNYEKFGRIYGRYDNQTPVLTVGEPEHLKTILIKDFHIFPNRRNIKFGDSIIDMSVANLEGNDWKRIRTCITPAFTVGRLKQMVPLIKECSYDFIDNIRDEVKSEGEVEFCKLYGAFIIDIIAQCMLGTKINSLKDPDNLFVSNAKRFLTSGIPLRAIIGVMFPSIARLFNLCVFDKSSVDFFRRFIIELIEKQQQDKKNPPAPNFLTMLLEIEKHSSEEENGNVLAKRLSHDEVVSQCVSFFVAGYQSTSGTLAVITHYLAVIPEIQERVRAEIQETLAKYKGEKNYEFYSDLKYLHNCIYEAIRINPPAARLERCSTEDYVLDKIRIPRGTLISIPFYAMHHDPELFPEPERYDPDRFSEERKASIPHCGFLPFGEGPRHCLGKIFATLTIKTAIVELLLNFRILPGKTTKEKYKIESNQGHLTPVSVKLKVVPLEQTIE